MKVLLLVQAKGKDEISSEDIKKWFQECMKKKKVKQTVDRSISTDDDSKDLKQVEDIDELQAMVIGLALKPKTDESCIDGGISSASKETEISANKIKTSEESGDASMQD